MAFEDVRYRCLSATTADSISDTFSDEHTSFFLAYYGRSDGQELRVVAVSSSQFTVRFVAFTTSSSQLQMTSRGASVAKTA